MTDVLTLPDTQQIALRLEKEILHLTLNRPEARNAMTAQMVAEMTGVFDSLDSKVRAVVIRGAGENFCAGGDIKDMTSLHQTPGENDLEVIAAYNAAAGKLFQTVNSAQQAVITILEGVVLGGGLGLACAADITIATKTVRFGLPETTLGLVPAQVAPFVRRRVGKSYARLLAVSGGQFDAAWAQRIGLVHYLVDNKLQLDSTLNSVLTEIKACAPQALACAKRLMSGQADRDLEHPDHLGSLFAQAMLSEEGKEGTAAFFEKRKPDWNR